MNVGPVRRADYDNVDERLDPIASPSTAGLSLVRDSAVPEAHSSPRNTESSSSKKTMEGAAVRPF